MRYLQFLIICSLGFHSFYALGGTITNIGGWKPTAQCDRDMALENERMGNYHLIVKAGHGEENSRILELKLRKFSDQKSVKDFLELIKENLKRADGAENQEVKSAARDFILRDLNSLDYALGDVNELWSKAHEHLAILELEKAARSEKRLQKYFDRNLDEADNNKAYVLGALKLGQKALVPCLSEKGLPDFKLNYIEMSVGEKAFSQPWVGDLRSLFSRIQSLRVNELTSDSKTGHSLTYFELLDFAFGTAFLWNQMANLYRLEEQAGQRWIGSAESDALIKEFVRAAIADPDRLGNYSRRLDILLESFFPSIVEMYLSSIRPPGYSIDDALHTWRMWQESAHHMRGPI